MDDSDFDGNQELGESSGATSAPDNPVRQSERGSVMPSFLHTPSKAEKDASRPAHLGPAASLKKSEDEAAKNGISGNENDEDARIAHIVNLAEKNGGVTKQGFLNKVTGRGKSKVGGKGLFKKKGAAIAIFISMIGGFMGFTFIGQATQPFAYVSNLIQNFNRGSFSMHARYKSVMRSILKDGKTATPEVKSSLKQVGVDIETDEDGKVKGYSYEGDDGEIKNIKTVEELDGALESDAALGSKVSKAAEIVDTESFYGEVKSTAATRIGWNKNRTRAYDSPDADTKTSSDGSFEKMAANENEPMTGETSNKYYDSDDNEVTKKEYYDLDESKRGKIEPVEMDQDNVKTSTKADQEASAKQIADLNEDGEGMINAKVIDVANKAFDEGVKAAKVYSLGACLYSGVSTAIMAITIGKQIMSAVNLGSGIFESTQKCQAGVGTCRSMHDYQDRMNSGSFWSAVSIQSLFGSDLAKSLSAGKANLEEQFHDKGILGDMIAGGATPAAWKNCTYSRIVANLGDIVSDAISVAAAFITGGVSILIKRVAKTIVFTAGVSLGIKMGIKKIINLAIDILNVDEVVELASSLGGNLATLGGEKMLSSMGQSIGHSTATIPAVKSFGAYANNVIALRAKYDRDNLSPFDTSSPNTFLGSILNSITKFSVLNLSGNNSPLLRTMSSMSSVVSGSIASILPQASASDYYNFASEPGDCPIANSIDAAANANNCYPYYVSDVDSFSISYEDAVDSLCAEEYLSCEKNEGSDSLKTSLKGAEEKEIKEFVVYSTQRDVHPGLADSRIASSTHKFDTGNDTLDSAIGGLPVIGSVIGAIDANNEAQNQDKIYGSEYVIGGEKWEEKKALYDNAEAYIELDTVYTQLGLIDHSAVAEFLDDYYEKNPLDQSYEGTLARFSGLTKEEVVSTLAYMDYVEETAKYQPAERYAFGSSDSKPILVTGGSKVKPEYMPAKEVAYYDLRSLNFAV